MNQVGKYALAAAAGSLGVSHLARADTIVFEERAGTAGTNGIVQQTGNAAEYYGATLHVTLPPLNRISKLTIAFAFFTYSGTDTYTPDIEVDLFNVNSSNLPTGAPIATAHNSSVTFTGSNYNNTGQAGTRAAQHNLTFDFSTYAITQNNFAFAYKDVNPAGTTAPYDGFSVFLSSAAPLTGTANPGWLTKYGGSWSGSNDYRVESTLTSVPEPCGVGILALGALATLRRRREI